MFVSFPRAIGHVFKHYLNFTGRSSRSEFWWWYLLYTLITITYNVLLDLALGGFADAVAQFSIQSPTLLLQALYERVGVVVIPFTLFYLVVFIPNLALAIRRLRDAGHTWASFFTPYIGLIFYIIGSVVTSTAVAQRDQTLIFIALAAFGFGGLLTVVFSIMLLIFYCQPSKLDLRFADSEATYDPYQVGRARLY